MFQPDLSGVLVELAGSWPSGTATWSNAEHAAWPICSFITRDFKNWHGKVTDALALGGIFPQCYSSVPHGIPLSACGEKLNKRERQVQNALISTTHPRVIVF
jgi:hypothetical protein